jgi:hypothetical protein
VDSVALVILGITRHAPTRTVTAGQANHVYYERQGEPKPVEVNGIARRRDGDERQGRPGEEEETEEGPDERVKRGPTGLD